MSRIVRWLAIVAMLGVAILFMSLAMSGGSAANRDVLFYWAAGRQLVQHRNPFDAGAIFAMEHAAGFVGSRAFFMRNGPTGFFLAAPLGEMSEKTAVIVWSLAILGSLMISVRMLWSMEGRPPDRLHLMGYLFPPVLACLLAGQVGVLMLLGVTLFLYLQERMPFAAGCALALLMLKPHLFLPFLAVLAIWALMEKRRVLWGMAAGVAAVLGIGFALDPRGWAEYGAMMRSVGLEQEFIPTMSVIFRIAVHRDWLWLQFLPAVIASVWAVIFYWRRRARWNWTTDGMLVLAVSVFAAPYAWFTDEAVLLPAILLSLYRASRAGISLLPFGILAGVALLEVFAGVDLATGFYAWTATAWLLWVVYVEKRARMVPATIVAA